MYERAGACSIRGNVAVVKAPIEIEAKDLVTESFNVTVTDQQEGSSVAHFWKQVNKCIDGSLMTAKKV
jgi:hypothetical protein